VRTAGSTVERQTNPADELLAQERKRMGEFQPHCSSSDPIVCAIFARTLARPGKAEVRRDGGLLRGYGPPTRTHVGLSGGRSNTSSRSSPVAATPTVTPQHAPQPLPRTNRVLGQKPRALLANPPRQDRIEQRLLEMQRPHPIAEQTRKLPVNIKHAGVQRCGRPRARWHQPKPSRIRRNHTNP
jgi:hypothetical protein